METKFTPGPWRLNTQYADIEVRGPEESGVLIAVMSPWGIAADEPSQQVANARLIAAAPELLAALEAMFDEHGGFDYTIGMLSKARAAIAKATGD